MTAYVRALVADEAIAGDAQVGELLIGEFLVNARLQAFGKTRKR